MRATSLKYIHNNEENETKVHDKKSQKYVSLNIGSSSVK